MANTKHQQEQQDEGIRHCLHRLAKNLCENLQKEKQMRAPQVREMLGGDEGWEKRGWGCGR